MAKKGTPEVAAVERRHPSESAVLDPSSLDPTMHYRFIQERPTQQMRARTRGYRIVKPSEDGVKTLLEQEDKTAEDVIKHGDRILMAIPKSRYERSRKELSARSEARLKANDERVRTLAKERGIRLHEVDEED